MKTSRCMLLILAVMVCVLFLAAPAFANVTLNKYEKQLVAAINKQRTKRGLAAVHVKARLVRASRSHSHEMATLKYFDHCSRDPEGETFGARLIRFGYTQSGCSMWKAGEDIYWGADLESSPVACVDAWMKSKAHRRVILTKAFRDIGVGAVKTDTGYGSVDGTVWFFTMDLGRRVLE